MGGIKIKIHPLTFAFALYSAISGSLGVFIVYTLSATIHEIGHSLVANNLGYQLNEIRLMPFGAVVCGANEFSPIDEIKIALAGPFINFLIGVLFTALWWVFPETYAYTDLCASANFALAFINLLPAYPLDGGRVLSSSLSLWLKEKTVKIISKTVGVIFSVLLLGLFVLSCFYTVNISLLFFALFVFVGAVDKKPQATFVRTRWTTSEKRLKIGVPINRIAISTHAKVKDLARSMARDRVNEFVVMDGDMEVAFLSQTDANKIIENSPYLDEISLFINKN